jgi:hypothetical protein
MANNNIDALNGLVKRQLYLFAQKKLAAPGDARHPLPDLRNSGFCSPSPLRPGFSRKYIAVATCKNQLRPDTHPGSSPVINKKFE